MSLKLKTSFVALAISAAASGALAGEHDTHNDREVLSEAYTNETELPNFVCWRKNQQGENIALFTSSIFPKGLDLDGYLTSDKYVAYPERVITEQAEMSVPTVSKSSLDFALGEAEEKTFEEAFADLSGFDQRAILQIMKANQNRGENCSPQTPDANMLLG